MVSCLQQSHHTMSVWNKEQDCVLYSERGRCILSISLLWVDLRSQRGFVQRKEKALGDTEHLISAKLSRLQQRGEETGIFVPPFAKVFNLVKPEGLSRCLIIKGVWTKGYSKPAGATNWTFSSVFDGWLPSEIVCFPSLCLCWITPEDSQRPALSPLLVKKNTLTLVLFQWCSDMLCSLRKGELRNESTWKVMLVCGVLGKV